MNYTPKEIIDAVHNAGIVGAGGGGFPTHVKLNAKVDTVIANGSECEPLLNTDKTLMLERPDAVVRGVALAMTAVGAKKGFIAVKGKYTDVIAAIGKELPADNSIEVFELENYYPAGDEFLTVYDVTGRVIPEGGLPLHVGVVVSNVLSLAQTADAMNGKAVTERPITVTGSVHNPQVITAPIGTFYAELIKIAGGTLNSDDVLIDGGPMMGSVVKDRETGIAKTTSGVIALPKDHFVINFLDITISQMVKKSKAACCQCYRCSDLCPRNLVGHKLYPHMTMRTIDYNLSEPTDHITSAFLCSQCGVCELIACDFMLLSPRKVYAEYRKLLASKGIKNPHTRSGFDALPELEYRKVALPTVIKKLGLSQYVKDTPSMGYRQTNLVRIALNKHTGAPAKPNVITGDTVRVGDLIAATPPHQLGALYHASIKGTVTRVTDSWIEIEGVG